MSDPDNITLDVIARIRTPFRERFGTPRQPGLVPSARGTIIFEKDYSSPDSVRGLEEFSHIWVVFIFDRVRRRSWKPLVRPPRLGGNEKVGIWSSRSPFRPNSIGLSLLKLDGIAINAGRAVLEVSGVDLTDGTPILDVKPYLPYVEAPLDAHGGWATQRPDFCEVEISTNIQQRWAGVPKETRGLICEILATNPSPAYRGEGELYRCEFEGWHVEWRVMDERVVIEHLSRCEI